MCDKMSEGIEQAISNFKPRKKFDLYKIIWENHFYYLEDQ
jgi:hypothetical protein